MELNDNSERWGRHFYRYRSLLPPGFIVLALGAVLLTTPFHISTSYSVAFLASMAALAAYILMVLSSKRKDNSFEAAYAAKGIYSVMRHPRYAAYALMMIAMALFTGVLWFFVVTILATVIILEKIVHYQERAMIARHGDEYRRWCAQTNALMPVSKSWQRSTSRKSIAALLGEQFAPMLVSLLGFAAIDAAKSLRIEFSLGDFTSLAMIFLLFLVSAAARLIGGKGK